MTKPLTLLMSRQAIDHFETRVADVLGDTPWRIVDLDAKPDADGIYPVDVAFLTRDVTGKSGKTDLAPTLTRYYEIVRAAPGLQWIQAHAAGMDRPIFAELHERGVRVTHGGGTTSMPVAQMAVAGLLALARRLPTLMDAQRRKAWEPLLPPRAPRDLSDQTAVIVGLGAIGQEIARLCKALGMTVIGISRSSEKPEHFDEVQPYENVDAVLPRADFVMLCCPLNTATRGLLNATRLARLPKGANVINVSRGEVLIEEDLAEALGSGHLGGAFLDVFQHEPLSPDSPFWTLPNVIISPHTAAHTAGHYEAVGKLFLQNLKRWREGQALINVATFA